MSEFFLKCLDFFFNYHEITFIYCNGCAAKTKTKQTKKKPTKNKNIETDILETKQKTFEKYLSSIDRMILALL